MPSLIRRARVSYGVLLVFSMLGLLASFVLSVEAITLAKNPDAELNCSINAVVNCAAVGAHETASVFGFPNAFVGMVTLPVMITIAMAGLMGVKFSRPFLLGGMIGALAGLLFAGWMLYTSFFVIRILCPWCLMLDVAMIGIAVAMFRIVLDNDALYLQKTATQKLRAFSKKGYDVLVGLLAVLVIAAAIIVTYGSSLQ